MLFRSTSQWVDATTGYVGYTGSAASAAGGVVHENGTSIASNYTMSSGVNGMSTGPITINSGVTVTIPSGQRWVVI